MAEDSKPLSKSNHEGVLMKIELISDLALALVALSLVKTQNPRGESERIYMHFMIK